MIGRVGYQVSYPRSWLALAVAVVVGVVCFFAMGVATSTVIPNQETARPVTSIVFFVLLYLAGLYFPPPPGSGVARFSSCLPVRRLILAMGRPFAIHSGASP